MKKIVLYPALLLLPFFSEAQQSNPKNQKEMQERLKEAQAEMDKLTPEQKKIMEQMGVRLPDAKSNPALDPKNSAAVSEATQNEFGGVPEKDVARIKNIPARSITGSTITNYIRQCDQQVVSKMKPADATVITEMYTGLKEKSYSPAVIGKLATCAWAMGHTETACGLMGKALLEDPVDPDNLNSYAAMLTMLDGEQIAIPLLNYLNMLYPKNSTVLNNLGQAWFNLGDIDKADNYLDSAIILFPAHPQANFTKSFIEERKGNTAKAVELVKKSMQTSVSIDKENRLRKLGYKLQYKDIHLPYKTDPDPMGLYEFKHPAFPADAASEKFLRPQWEAYQQAVAEKAVALQQQLNQLITPALNKNIADGQKAAAAYQKRGVYAAIGGGQEEVFTSPLHRRADIKLRLLNEDKAFQDRAPNAKKAIEAYRKAKAAFAVQYQKDFEVLHGKEGAARMGELTYNANFCKEHIGLVNNYYKQANNTELEGLYDNYLKLLRVQLNEEIFWKQFTKTREAFEAEVLRYQIQWLGALSQGIYLGYHEMGMIKVTAGECTEEKEGKRLGKLADFNTITCKTRETLNFGAIGEMVFECGKLTSTLRIPLPKGLYAELTVVTDINHAGKHDAFLDDFETCNVEFGAGGSVGSGKAGPLKAEGSLKGGAGVEIGRKGIQDFYVTGEAKIEVGTNVAGDWSDENNTAISVGGIGIKDQSIDMGMEGRISINTGKGHTGGVGVFKDAKIDF